VQALNNWERRKGPGYESPVLPAIANSWLAETSLALDAMHQAIASRHTICLFARSAPYLAPLRRQAAEFDRMLTSAGLPTNDRSA
jgi:hypothetical protein